MSAVPDALRSHRDEILRRWVERIRTRTGEDAAAPVLLDSLPQYLELLADALEARGGPRALEAAKVAEEHGTQRSLLGVDLSQVVTEYRTLREVAIEVAGPGRRRPRRGRAGALGPPHRRRRRGAARLGGGAPGGAAPVSGAARARRRLLRARPRVAVRPRQREPGAPVGQVAERDARPAVLGGVAGPRPARQPVLGRVPSRHGRARRARVRRLLPSARSLDPLGAILLGASTLLAKDDLPDQHLRAVARIRNAAARATRLIHDLLDFTRARLLGSLPVQPRPADLATVVGDAVEELRATLGQREIGVARHGALDGSWDPDRLAQVASNLLANAVKYGRPDRPVTVELDGRAPEAVLLRVSNEGDPIPPELLHRLFQPWQRGGEQGAAAQGVGLGLFIVERIVAAHGGTIRATSTAEEGTIFEVRLPRAAPTGAAPSRPPAG